MEFEGSFDDYLAETAEDDAPLTDDEIADADAAAWVAYEMRCERDAFRCYC